ncbi:hypothetical protein C0991_006422, partial [Blastosporella zonata]
DIGRGPSTAKLTKILKGGPKLAKAKKEGHNKSMANVAHAHPTDKDTIDKGLEGEIGVHL